MRINNKKTDKEVELVVAYTNMKEWRHLVFGLLLIVLLAFGVGMYHLMITGNYTLFWIALISGYALMGVTEFYVKKKYRKAIDNVKELAEEIQGHDNIFS